MSLRSELNILSLKFSSYILPIPMLLLNKCSFFGETLFDIGKLRICIYFISKLHFFCIPVFVSNDVGRYIRFSLSILIIPATNTLYVRYKYNL